eukprot:6181650-Pleurochrysis_carterae.AAC.1
MALRALRIEWRDRLTLRTCFGRTFPDRLYISNERSGQSPPPSPRMGQQQGEGRPRPPNIVELGLKSEEYSDQLKCAWPTAVRR